LLLCDFKVINFKSYEIFKQIKEKASKASKYLTLEAIKNYLFFQKTLDKLT